MRLELTWLPLHVREAPSGHVAEAVGAAIDEEPHRYGTVVEARDEWAVAERRYLSEESMAKLYAAAPDDTTELAEEQLPLPVTA